MSGDPYDHERAFEGLKPLRNAIRKFSTASLLQHALAAVNHPSASEIQRMRSFPPPLLLTLIERILLYADFGKPVERHATPDQFINLMNKVHDYSNRHGRLPTEYDSIWSFARTMGFRQFWLQHRSPSVDLGRQRLLFQILPGHDPYLGRQIEKLTGLSPEAYFDVIAYLWAHFSNERNSPLLAPGTLGQVFPAIPKEAQIAYFSRCARGPEALATELRGLYGLRGDAKVSVEEQMFGQSPLWRFPFLTTGRGFGLFGRPLLWAHARDYLFERLREDDASGFGVHFGDVFEGYLRLGLDHARVPYWPEATLRRHLGDDGKVVDFTVFAGDSVILVDAKGVLLPSERRGPVTRRDIASQLKATVMKAIGQGLHTAERLREQGLVGGRDLRGVEFFLLIVAPRDLYLAGGADFIQNYGERAYGKGPPAIDPEHIFVTSAEEWDRMWAAVAQGLITLPDALRGRVAKNRERKTLSFHQHLLENLPIRSPPYLVSAHSEVLDRLQSRLAPR